MAWTSTDFQASRSEGPATFVWRVTGVSTVVENKTHAVNYADSPLKIDLTRSIADRIVPGSLQFTLGGKIYIDRNGTLYTDIDPATGSGLAAGTINYLSGEIALSYWAGGGPAAMTVDSCLTAFGNFTACEAFFRTPGAPVRPGSFYVQATTADGVLLSAVATDGGGISGPNIAGRIDQDTGIVRLSFGEMVAAAGNESAWWYRPSAVQNGQIWKPVSILPSTLTYSCVLLTSLPLNADVIGLDPVRLPADGRVPIYRPGDVCVIHNTQRMALPNPAQGGAVIPLGRDNLSSLWVEDQAGKRLGEDQYQADLAQGTLTLGQPLSLAGLAQPLVAVHRVEDMAMILDVQINGELTLGAPLSRDYGVGSFVSSALHFGDLSARVEFLHELKTWQTWANTPTGDAPTGRYNAIDYPVEVKNDGAVTERWRIHFTSVAAFQLIGENLGVVATGTTTSDFSPINQLTGKPYLTLRAAGWGVADTWAAGNQLRLNTVAACVPVWIARTALPGCTLENDAFSAEMRGDVDAP